MNQQALEKLDLFNWYGEYRGTEITQRELLQKAIFNVRFFPNRYHPVKVQFTKQFGNLEELKIKELESLIKDSNINVNLNNKNDKIRYKYDLILALLFHQ